LGIPQPNVHYYNEDIKLPEELNIDSEDEAPTYRPRSEPVSEEEVQQPVYEDYAIRHSPINPMVLTPQS
jgi:hypothetical protein